MSEKMGRASLVFDAEELVPQGKRKIENVEEVDRIARERGYTSREAPAVEETARPGRPARKSPAKSLHISADVDIVDAFSALRESKGWTSGRLLKELMQKYSENED